MATPDSAVQVGLPRLNEPAPDFEAVTTHGPLTLSNQRGSWVLLFSQHTRLALQFRSWWRPWALDGCRTRCAAMERSCASLRLSWALC